MKFITFYSVIKNIQLYMSLRIKTVLFIIHQIPILFFNYVQQRFDLFKSNEMIYLGKKKPNLTKQYQNIFTDKTNGNGKRSVL